MQKLTAAIIIIGNEILSGNTQDQNISYIAVQLAKKGIKLCEARIILDEEKAIIATVLELSNKYTYIFTTGGIGPTHDDITSAAIAKAFGGKLELNQAALKSLTDYYQNRGREVNEASKKMAFIPEGATLITNSLTAAPGFRLANVFVMAGIPQIMQTMLQAILPDLNSGLEIKIKTLTVEIGESLIAKEFAKLQQKYPYIEMGSYPILNFEKPSTSLVLRGDDNELLSSAFNDLKLIIHQLGYTFSER